MSSAAYRSSGTAGATEATLAAISAQLPASLGQKTMANSMAVVIASDQSAIPVTVSGVATEVTLAAMSAKLPASLGQKASAASISAVLSTENEALIGALTETAPATDTASSGLNGRMQRISQRLTSLIALLPSSIGQKADAASLAVSLSTEQAGLIGALTETAPATDTASSGLNGRLQRIAQRITSLIALVPASLGQKAMSASFAVAIASDQSNVPTQEAQNVNGTQTTGTVTTASTLTAPADAIGFILQASDQNSVNLRYRIGATATTTVGQQLQPGRDTGFVPCAANISVIAEDGATSSEYEVQWIRR